MEASVRRSGERPPIASRWGHRQGARCSPKALTVGTLQTLPVCELDEFADTVGRVSAFSLHTGVAACIGHMERREQRLANIEALLGELVELQKTNQ
jgi:hypothetical protein